MLNINLEMLYNVRVHIKFIIAIFVHAPKYYSMIFMLFLLIGLKT